ncbi:TPA: DUF551 domain-containing protein [Escherichia coli]|nr:DUF551 domain-containing protein [Escherichia coli]
MSTITKERIELFIKSPLENGLTRGEQMEVARIALASLEADPIGEVSEKRYGLIMDGTVDLGGKSTYRIIKGEKAMKLFPLGTKFYTAPPAPVSVPAAMEIDDDFDSAFEHGKAVGWNAYRAAMLQAEPVSNSDELPLDYLQGHKDGLEWAAQLAEANHPQTGDWLYDDQIDLARAIRKGPDMPTVQGGNSPVIPDGWISCSERMPEETGDIIVVSDGIVMSGISYSRRDGFYMAALEYDDDEPIDGVTHWMPLPEPPQEAK